MSVLEKLRRLKDQYPADPIPSNLPLQKDLRRLAGGIHGEVFKLSENRVIKICESDLSERGKLKLKEIYGLTLKYQSLVTTYSVGFWKEYHWAVMEYLPRRVDSKEFTFVKCVADFSLELQHHSLWRDYRWRQFAKDVRKLKNKHGLVHPDLHSNNILLNSRGRPKIIDLESYHPDLWNY